MENENLILNKLNILSKEIAKIKEQIADLVLTNDDVELLDEIDIDLKGSKTKRLDLIGLNKTNG